MEEKEKKELLKKVWNECTFDEIIDAGFEMNKCGAMDLKVAADEFTNHEKEYSVDEIKEIIKQSDITDIIDALLDVHTMHKIINELGEDNIIEEIDNGDLLDYLKGSWTLDNYISNIRLESYNEGMTDAHKDFEIIRDEKLNNLQNCNADELHEFICDYMGIGYYDEEGHEKHLKQVIKKLNENNFGVKYSLQ